MVDAQDRKPRLWVRCLIYWHCAVLLICLMPPASAVAQSLAPICSRYVSVLGLWQNWGMFAPSPYDWDVYIQADVTTADHQHLLFEFPRMSTTDVWDRYWVERWRKLIENLQASGHEAFWFALSRYAVYQLHCVCPCDVVLSRHTHPVALPGQKDPGWSSVDIYRTRFASQVYGKQVLP